jgi:NAD(P)-dependent dehydrogenase (short-subunit alcohol dehydrogenase family)
MAQPLESQTVSDHRPPRLLRGFSFRSALSLAFADVSPIAAVYAIFTLGLFAAGPKFFWAFPIVLIGQLLVAAVFGELASRWPYAGSVYQWSRHVRGTTWGWAAMWAYMWGLAGLIALTKTLGRELAPENITVNAVAPGVIDTPQLQVDADNAKVSLAEMHEEYSRGIPIGRIGRADEIASAVALLARKDLGAFVGQTIQVNGGSTRCRA